MTGRATHHRWDDLPREELNPLIGRRLVTGERMMLAHVYLAQGAVVPKHAHENEQLTYILEGRLRFRLGEDGSEVVDVAAGEVLHIPSHLPHEAEALEDTLDVDIFIDPTEQGRPARSREIKGKSSGVRALERRRHRGELSDSASPHQRRDARPRSPRIGPSPNTS